MLAEDDDFVARLDRATQGLALYLRYLVDDLLATVKTGRKTAPSLQLTPKKFSGYVREQMQILARDVFAKEPKREALRKLFAVLAVAVAELPEDDVCALTGFDVFDLLSLPWAITRWFTRRTIRIPERWRTRSPTRCWLREFGIALGPLAGAARRELLQFCSHWHRSEAGLHCSTMPGNWRMPIAAASLSHWRATAPIFRRKRKAFPGSRVCL